MNHYIVVESKAWNHADISEGRINTRWEDEIGFDILEFQVRNEKDETVFRSVDEDVVINWIMSEERNQLKFLKV